MTPELFEEIKKRIEVDGSDIYDDLIESYINSGIVYLSANDIPVATHLDAHYYQYVDWLDGYVTVRLEKDLNTTTLNLIETNMMAVLWQMKAFFDEGGL